MAYHIEEMGEFSERDIRNMFFTMKESEAVTFGEQAADVVMSALKKHNKACTDSGKLSFFTHCYRIDYGNGEYAIARARFERERKTRYLKSW